MPKDLDDAGWDTLSDHDWNVQLDQKIEALNVGRGEVKLAARLRQF